MSVDFTVSIDLDDTLSNLLIEWIKRYNHKYNDSVTLDQVDDWAIEKFFTKCTRPQAFQLLGGDFFETVSVKEDAKLLIETLRKEKIEFFIVTAYYREACLPKIKWCERELDITENDIIFCNKKYRINSSVHLDDGIHNFVDKYGMPRRDIEKIVVNMPHNRNGSLDSYYRVDGLKDAIPIILRLRNNHNNKHIKDKNKA